MQRVYTVELLQMEMGLDPKMLPISYVYPSYFIVETDLFICQILKNSTAFRGIQQTSDEGVAQFVTVFPGHYTGRATHIHIMAHQTDGSLNDNDTYTGGTVSHVGQLFFDQDLISSVEAISPYTTNSQTLTTNSEDGIFSDEAVNIDPVMEYVLLGDNIGDGILAWVSFGINTTVSHTVSAAATWTADGGVSNGNSSGPGGPPPPSS